jgi:hypothetical protein
VHGLAHRVVKRATNPAMGAKKPKAAETEGKRESHWKTQSQATLPHRVQAEAGNFIPTET